MKKLNAFLIALILFGIFMRFYGLEDSLVWRDEAINIAAGIKLNQNNPYDARFFASEHPPVAKFFLGLPSRFIQADYADVLAIQPHLFVYTYLAPFKEVVAPIRMMSALAGVAALIFIFFISKEVHSLKAALWSTALAALSLDMLIDSRLIYPNMYALMFSLGTVYFYIKYLKTPSAGKSEAPSPATSFSVYFSENKKALYALLMLAFLILALGSRLLYPAFLVPIILISHILLRRGWKDTIFVLILNIFALYVFLNVLYPPDLQQFAFEVHYGVQGYTGFLQTQFALPTVIQILLTRHSYAFLAAFILTLFSLLMFLRRLKKEHLNVRRIALFCRSLDTRLVLALFFIISFLIYSFTRYGLLIFYTSLLFLPLFIFAGHAIASSKRRIVPTVMSALLILNVYTIIALHPNYAEYANFDVKQFYVSDFYGSYDPLHIEEEVISYLASIGSPQVISNNHNVLFKYEALPIPPPGHPDCNQQFIDSLRGSYIVYRGLYSTAPSFSEDPYICPEFRSLDIELVESFETSSPEDRFPFYVYRIK